jgi:hypothetical protein
VQLFSDSHFDGHDDLMAVRIRSEALDSKGADRWYVTDGMNAVGPVRLDLLARGVEAGRVPLDSFVRHEAWKVWRPLTDFTEFVDDGSGKPKDSKPAISAPLSSASFIDDEGSQGERPTIEVTSGGVSNFAASTEAPTVDPNALEGASLTNDVPTETVGRDLLGGDRPTLASYLDDEETKVPSKRPSVAPAASPPPRVSGAVPPTSAPRPRSVPPPVPRPRTVPPPKAGSLPPPRSPSVPPRSPSVPPGIIPPGMGTPLPITAGSRTDDVPSSSEGWGFARPFESGEVLPEDDLTGAADLSDGLLLLLGAAVRRSHADVALLHRLADDGASVVCAHGPQMIDLLGLRTRLLDAAVVAAAGGHVVIAEPVPGHAGDATIVRLRKLGIDPEGAVMFPIRPKNRLLGFLEIGKKTRFTLRELSRVEALVAAFVRKATEMGWAP